MPAALRGAGLARLSTLADRLWNEPHKMTLGAAESVASAIALGVVALGAAGAALAVRRGWL